MSTSIIEYNGKYFDAIDSQLIVALFFFKKSLHNKKLASWFENYLKNVIEPIIDVKPVGWADLELEDFFDEEKNRVYFIKLLNNCIEFLNLRKEDTIDNALINLILKLEGDEAWTENNFIKLVDIINVLEDIKLLLDDNIKTDNERLNIYEKPPYSDEES